MLELLLKTPQDVCQQDNCVCRDSGLPPGGCRAVLDVMGELNSLVGQRPQILVCRPGQSVLDITTDALFGLVRWRYHLTFPEVTAGVIDRPAQRVQDADTVGADRPVIMSGGRSLKAPPQFLDLFIDDRPARPRSRGDRVDQRLQCRLFQAHKAVMERFETLIEQITAGLP